MTSTPTLQERLRLLAIEASETRHVRYGEVMFEALDALDGKNEQIKKLRKALEIVATQDTPTHFSNGVYAYLAQTALKETEPLGPEFEKVWDANVDKLYEK